MFSRSLVLSQLRTIGVRQFSASKKLAHSPRVYAWGRCNTGALGVAEYMEKGVNNQPVREIRNWPDRVKIFESFDLNIKSIACGLDYTVYLTKSKNENKLIGHGINTDSQLGFQPLNRNPDPDKKASGGKERFLDYVASPLPITLPFFHKLTTIKDFACGRAHTLILTDNEGVYSIGHNGYGQCGRIRVADENYEGNRLVHRIIELPQDINQVCCGFDHSLFVGDDGSVYACGFGTEFQTGLGRNESNSVPEKLKGALKGVRIVKINGGADTTLAVSDEGELYGWGNNEYSQLPSVGKATVSEPVHIPVEYGKVKKAVVGGTIAAALTTEGSVYVWGFGILGKGPNVTQAKEPIKLPEPLFGQNELNPTSKVVDIDCGLYHFAVLTSTGDVYTWGKNNWGQLGLAHCNDQYFPLRVAVPAKVTNIACGVHHMIVQAESFA